MQKNLTLTFIKFIIISLLTLAIPTIAIEKYQLYSITLTENSILYIYSTIAQVVAGLMALTLVAVPYLFTLLEKNIQQDNGWETAVSIAKQNVFEYLLMIFLIGIISILFCLFVIGTFNYLDYQNYSLTIATCSFLYFILIVLYLIFFSFDPTRLSKINDEYVEKYLKDKNDENISNSQVISPESIEPEIISGDSKIQETNNISSSIGNFFIEYSKFEDFINECYKNLKAPVRQPPFIQQIKELNNFNVNSV